MNGSNSLRARRFRSTTAPVSSVPATCNTHWAMSILKTLIGYAMGLASLECMVALTTATMLALRSRSEKRQVPGMTTMQRAATPWLALAASARACGRSHP